MYRIPQAVKENAIILRKQGYSLQEIADTCQITKSTASLWLREIHLSQKAQNRLTQRAIIGQLKTQEIKREKREQIFKEYRQQASNEIREIPYNQTLIRLICSVLFWCEGSKNTIQVKFTNSDPEMIKYYLSLLRVGFTLDESKFRGLVHLHEYHDEQKQIDFWSQVTKIPKNQFHRSYRKLHTGKRLKENYQGCICITYFDAKLAKQLWAYYKEAPHFSLGA